MDQFCFHKVKEILRTLDSNSDIDSIDFNQTSVKLRSVYSL